MRCQTWLEWRNKDSRVWDTSGKRAGVKWGTRKLRFLWLPHHSKQYPHGNGTFLSILGSCQRRRAQRWPAIGNFPKTEEIPGTWEFLCKTFKVPGELGPKTFIVQSEYLFVLRQGLTRPQVASNLLCSQGWLWTSNLPGSTTLPPLCWKYRCVLSHSIYTVVRIKISPQIIFLFVYFNNQSPEHCCLLLSTGTGKSWAISIHAWGFLKWEILYLWRKEE